MLSSLLALCAGASAGAVLRWLLGLALNSFFPIVPLGTLAANWLGGYIIGLALSLFAFFPALGAEWRLPVVTGFLGALTTFSTFSAEVAALIQQGRRRRGAACLRLFAYDVSGDGNILPDPAGLERVALEPAFARGPWPTPGAKPPPCVKTGKARDVSDRLSDRAPRGGLTRKNAERHFASWPVPRYCRLLWCCADALAASNVRPGRECATSTRG